MIDSILCEGGLWLMAKKKRFRECSLNVFLRDWVTCISFSPLMSHDQTKDWVSQWLEK